MVRSTNDFYGFWVVLLYGGFRVMYMVNSCFLTTIGIEKCLTILFPPWYQCHQPKSLLAKKSFMIWTLSGMFSGMWISFFLVYGISLLPVTWILFTVTSWILPSLVTFCTVVLLTKLCCGDRQYLPGSLSTAIILMLLFFLIFGIPCIVGKSMGCLKDPGLLLAFSYLCFSVNSSIKPTLYYLVGKTWRCHSEDPLTIREFSKMKGIL